MGRRSFEKMYTADQMREYAKRVVADEREACAKVCDAYGQMGLGANSTANAIRARGQA